MKRLITTFASTIFLLTFTACATQPACNGEEMIVMKDKGFDRIASRPCACLAGSISGE